MPRTWAGSWLGDGTVISWRRLSSWVAVSRLTVEGASEVMVALLAALVKGMPSSSLPISSARSTMARLEVLKSIWSPRVR